MDGLRILTISGWTQPSDALLGIVPHAEFVDYSDYKTIDEIADSLTETNYDAVIAWSLGGVISRQLLNTGALQAQAFISLSAPFQFVRDARLDPAMPPDTYEQFYSNYAQETQRTVDRFHGLVAKGDARMREVLSELSHHSDVLATEKWLPWLKFLEDYSAHDHDYEHLPPTLILHGQADAIIPYAQSELLRDHIGASHVMLEGCGHAPHVHNPEKVKDLIHQFIQTHKAN